MTLISLVCLLALSSSAFARSVPLTGYGGGYDNTLAPRMATVLTGSNFNGMSSGLLQDTSSVSAYGSALVPQTRTLSNYGSGMTRALEFDTSAPIAPILVVDPVPETQADILCRGQRPETVIPIENNRKFVVCLDDGKGTEQECPKGLVYHEQTRRCERKLGPADNLCLSSPCLNGGQCLPTDSWFQCQCAPGFDGPTCELDARICQQQQPCGSLGRCQSFRLNAALSYICLFQDESAYGLNTQQIISSPCHNYDGPQALAVSNKGFLMCDGERMFVEACPGGTVWDDAGKACVWAEEMTTGTIVDHRSIHTDRSAYGSGYGETRTLINKPTYGGYGGERVIHRPKVMTSSYGGENLLVAPKAIESGYGGGYGGDKLILTKHVDSGYGGEKVFDRTINTGYGGEKVLERTLNTGYGGEKVLVTPKFIDSGYGSQKVFVAPKAIESGYGGGYGGEKVIHAKRIDSGYGGEKVLERTLNTGYGGERVLVTPKLIDSGYGGEKVIHTKHVDSGYGGEKLIQTRLVDSGYGGEKLIETKHVDSGYGGEKLIQPRLVDSGYGGEKHIQTRIVDSGYGGEKAIVRPKLVDSGYGGEKLIQTRIVDSGYGSDKAILRPKLIDSGYGGQQEEMISTRKVSGGY